MGKKYDLSYCDCGRMVCAQQDSLSIFKTAFLLGFSHTTFSTITQIGAKNKKRPVNGSSADRNVLLMREVRGEWPGWLELTERLFYSLLRNNRGLSIPLDLQECHLQHSNKHIYILHILLWEKAQAIPSCITGDISLLRHKCWMNWCLQLWWHHQQLQWERE